MVPRKNLTLIVILLNGTNIHYDRITMKQFVLKYWLHIIFTFMVLIAILGWYYLRNPIGPKLQINNQVFTIELALTEPQQRQGLSGREMLPENHGMLFVYPGKNMYSFWMKDMKFALDFIWIDDTTVVDITKNVLPPTITGNTLTVMPNQQVNRILELNAGTVDRVGIKKGDTVTFLRK